MVLVVVAMCVDHARSGRELRRQLFSVIQSNHTLVQRSAQLVATIDANVERQNALTVGLFESVHGQIQASHGRVLEALDVAERQSLLRRLGIGDYALDPDAHVAAVIRGWQKALNCSSDEAIRLALASIRDPNRNQDFDEAR